MPPRNDRDLARRNRPKEQKKYFWIISEGEKTEPGYFRALHSIFPGVIIKPRHGGKPEECVAHAKRLLAELKRKGEWKTGDRIWLVFDRDDHAHFHQAVTDCLQAGFGLGRSNPCFEVWLILHKEEFHKCCDADGAERHLETLYPDYDRSRTKTMDFDALVQDLAKAEEYAVKLLSKRIDENNPHGAPSTTVHELTEAIRKASKAWTG